MTKNAGDPNSYFEKFLEEKFTRVFGKLDSIDQDNHQRRLDVNMMDTANKAESKAIKDLIEEVRDTFISITDAQDQRIQRLEWILKTFVWLVITVSGGITWFSGIWKNVMR
jgi:hypothetical protein